MKKGTRISRILFSLFLFVTLVGICQIETKAASYPIVIFFSDENFENVVVSMDANAGDTVPIRMKWYAEYNYEGYEIEIQDSNGNVISTAEKTWTNLYYSINFTINWDTTGLEAGNYKVIVKKKFYSLYRWNEAPTNDVLYINLLHSHTVVTDPAVSATCTTEGKTEGSHCSTCGAVIVPQTIIPATGHNIVPLPAIEATCENAGKTEGSYCSVCNAIITPQRTINKKQHKFIYKNKKSPTYFSEGYSGDQICSVCGYEGGIGDVIDKKVLSKVSIKKLVSPSNKKISITWNKNKNSTGYEIQYSIDKKFKKATKTIKINKNTVLSRNIQKLASKKEYYVRIRCYRTEKINGKNKTAYSSWCTAKKCKVK